MTLGIGREGLRRIAVDAELALEAGALRTAIREDRAAGWLPCAVVATIGTTGSTAVDPVAGIAEVARDEGIWLHVDAAYAGVVALLPERRASSFAGWERADSIVVNPHKWLFTPLDCSLFLTSRMEVLRAAFSLVPEYLRTLDQAGTVRDFNEYTPQLGRRFRALKIWFVMRYFGLEGIRRRLRAHLELAQRLRAGIEAEPDAEVLAPSPFATVCFRWRPRALAGMDGDPSVEAVLTELNERLMAAVNASGEIFISHTRLDGRSRAAHRARQHPHRRTARGTRLGPDRRAWPPAGGGAVGRRGGDAVRRSRRLTGQGAGRADVQHVWDDGAT